MTIFSTIGNLLSSTYNKVETFLVGSENKGLIAKSTSQAAIAVSAPIIVSSGLVSTVASAAKVAVNPIISSLSKSYTNAFATKPIKTTIGTVATGLVGVTVAKSSTAKQAILKLPSSANTLTTNVAQFIDDPSTETGIKILEDNPVLSGALIGLGALSAGKGLISATTSLLNTSAIREQTNTIKGSKGSGVKILNTDGTLPAPQNDSSYKKGLTPLSSAVPITPQTQVLGKPAGTKSLSKYRKTIKKPTNYNQTMKVNIFNQSKHLYTRGIYN